MTKYFYDKLSPFYHLIFPNWENSIKWQGKIIDDIIKSTWGDNSTSVLDVSCGIGTQSIGLANLGYSVKASDISPKEIKRAKKETIARGLDVSYSVSDMRNVSKDHSEKFDILISCDNSIPHLLSDQEILKAFKEFHKCLKTGGGCLITLRDYEKENREGIPIKPYGVHEHNGVKNILFQTWEFDNDIYQLSMYLTTDDGQNEPKTIVFRSKYYAVTLSKIIHLLIEAGFSKAQHQKCNYYQPVIVATA